MKRIAPKEPFKRLEDVREARGLDIDEFTNTHLGVAPHKYRDWTKGNCEPSKEVHKDMEKKLLDLEETS